MRYGETIPARFEPDMLREIENWAEKAEVSRSEAVRKLVEIGLGKSSRTVTSSKTSAVRAKELAGKTIDHLVDPTAPAEEKAIRKSRLIKGPSEFRETRVDQPTKK